MRISDMGEPTSLKGLHKSFADQLADYEEEKKWETSTIMDIFLTAVMKKYNLKEIQLSVTDLMEADTDWIIRNSRGSVTNGLHIKFKGEKDTNES